MSDRLNEELLSAYLDNEVTAEERAEVERALVSSAETRRSLDALKQVQARLQATPRFTLPANFHERVVMEVERRTPNEAVTAPAKTLATTKWLRIAAIAGTVAAAILIAIVVVTNNLPEPEIVEVPIPGGTDLVGMDRTGAGQDLPDNETIAVNERVDKDLILVLDLAITKKGQREDLFGQALKNAGIPFDPRQDGVTLAPKLQKELLASRFVEGVDKAANANDKFDVVDMVYIQAPGDVFDAFETSVTNHPQIRARYNLALNPETVQVLNSVGQESWSFARAESSKPPRVYAYRLNLGITLHSSRSGFLARFPTPGLDVKVLEKDASRANSGGLNLPFPLDLGTGQRKREQPKDGNQQVSQVEMFEILVIRRNLVGGFPKNAQKADDN